ncbi:hypothetical protein [Acinetobacter sp.]|jgi:hypothetical protein|uniref:hypothetical protein n=1 Tax=Acinetobacter sp. TaxID=472 RepID=UPI00283486C5|nr:hypothetical protein [Acinetobacter sp.]MDR0234843.1 hypothetical protein [Acinetobacter sp.]
MRDLKYKVDIIRSIEQLQLPNHFIQALDDAHQAENIIKLINYLKDMNEQWY